MISGIPLFMQESYFYSVGKKICRESMIFYIGLIPLAGYQSFQKDLWYLALLCGGKLRANGLPGLELGGLYRQGNAVDADREKGCPSAGTARTDAGCNLHACQAIIKRNVGPGYTNISVMGAYVTIVAGELFGWTNTLEYGKKRLERLYEYNKSKGNFSEFNSPTYTFVALIDLNDLKLHSKDDACRAMAEELCDMAWRP